MDYTDRKYIHHPVQIFMMLDHVVGLLNQKGIPIYTYSPHDDHLLDQHHYKEDFLYISFINPPDAWTIFNMLRDTLHIYDVCEMRVIWLENHNYIHFTPYVANEILTRLMNYINLYEMI